MAFNILCYIKDEETFLSRVFEMLKPDGVFLSATDCLGEDSGLIMHMQSLLCKIGLLPYTSTYKINELTSIIECNGFIIKESCNLHGNPPNLFIAALKK